jgi:hypothetical protein
LKTKIITEIENIKNQIDTKNISKETEAILKKRIKLLKFKISKRRAK